MPWAHGKKGGREGGRKGVNSGVEFFVIIIVNLYDNGLKRQKRKGGKEGRKYLQVFRKVELGELGSGLRECDALYLSNDKGCDRRGQVRRRV